MTLPGNKKVRLFDLAFDRAAVRLSDGMSCDMSIGGLVLVAVGIIGLACATKSFDSANPRLSYPGKTVDIGLSPASVNPGIWFSMTPEGDNVVVTTDDRRVFEWPLDPKIAMENRSYKDFTNFLKIRRDQTVEDFVLAMRKTGVQSGTMAVVAMDDRLTYAHFKPVMLALAGAGIRSYGFETSVGGDE